MFLLKQVIESFGYHYKDYIDFLEKFNIFDRVTRKPSAIILLNSLQLEQEFNMLDDIIQEKSLYAHIVFKSPCLLFPSLVKDNCVLFCKLKFPIQFIEKKFDIDFYSIERPIIHNCTPSFWDKCFQIFIKYI